MQLSKHERTTLAELRSKSSEVTFNELFDEMNMSSSDLYGTLKRLRNRGQVVGKRRASDASPLGVMYYSAAEAGAESDEPEPPDAA